MRTRTLITLIVAALAGVVAFVATSDMVRSGRHAPVSHSDEDPGLIP